MKTNLFSLMALLFVCSVLCAQTPDSVRVEMTSDTVALSESVDTVETVPYRSLQMGIPADESGTTYKAPNLRYSNQVRVGKVAFDREYGTPKKSAEPNIPVSTPDGRTLNSNNNSGAGFKMSWGK